MADFKVILPSMGEGVMEATITAWVKQVGDFIEEDETLVEIATDKVDSEVPSPVSGTIKQLLFNVDDIAKINEAIAVIEVESSQENQEGASKEAENIEGDKPEEIAAEQQPAIDQEVEEELLEPLGSATVDEENDYVLSPLVKSIIQKENITRQELAMISGTGKNKRITKEDLLTFLENRSAPIADNQGNPVAEKTGIAKNTNATTNPAKKSKDTLQVVSSNASEEVIEMDRMRKLIAKHMVDSKRIAPHVTSFVEADMTNVVLWRNKHKADFQKRTGNKLTFMPMLIHALVQSIKDFPMINASVNGDQIIRKKDINIGMAAALPSGNLIVPVIKRADQLSLQGLTERINDLANRARNNALKPHEITEGTYTITNVGSFGNIMGTPIINQPQVAIMAVGAIQKKPAVIETPQGDVIAIRHKMYLSHAYDHRVVDGALGGMFVKRMAEYLENFDPETTI